MSANGLITIDWGDGTHTFRLAIGQIQELQEKTKVGPRRLWMRIISGDWLVDDLRETIRLGLIGGGTPPVVALGLVRRYVEERPLLESIQPAIQILAAALNGVPDDPVGKTPAEEAKNQTIPTADPGSSPSPHSMN